MKSFDKIAIVCDWLTEIGGAEKVLAEIAKMFPNAPIFTSQYRRKSAPKFFRGRKIKTGWLNFLPRFCRKFLSPLRYIYFAHLNLEKYDLVISVTNAEAKNLPRKNLAKNAVHVAYLQGPPTQYYWGLYDQYLENPGFSKLNFLARFGLKLLVKPLRKKDFAAAQKPDFLIANSTYVKAEIKKYYDRDSMIIFPPVDVENIAKLSTKISEKDSRICREKLFNGEDFFMISGRQVNWKRIDLAIKACAKLNENLLVIGDGAEHENLVKLAGEIMENPAQKFDENAKISNKNSRIKFLPGYNGAAEIVQYFKAARGFIFPSLEPFGITPVESLAAGLPVIALKNGGALDFIQEDKNGVFFSEQNADSLAAAIQKFKKIKFDEKVVAASAREFSETNFKENFLKIIEKICDEKIAICDKKTEKGNQK